MIQPNVKIPFLHRRGDTFYFRVAVPERLRQLVGIREITKTLRSSDRKKAAPVALRCACEIKLIFECLTGMDEINKLGDDNIVSDLIDKRLDDAIEEVRLSDLRPKNVLEFAREFQNKAWIEREREAHQDELDELKRKHRLELERTRERVELETLRKIHFEHASTEKATKTTAKKASSIPTVQQAFDGFVLNYRPRKCEGDGKKNLVKIQGLGDLFVSFLGTDKRIDEILQSDVNEFFRQLVGYPGGRGGRSDEFNRMGFTERLKFAKQNGLERISLKTYNSNYKSPCGLFIKHLKAVYDDVAPAITVDSVDYC